VQTVCKLYVAVSQDVTFVVIVFVDISAIAAAFVGMTVYQVWLL